MKSDDVDASSIPEDCAVTLMASCFVFHRLQSFGVRCRLMLLTNLLSMQCSRHVAKCYDPVAPMAERVGS